MERRHIAMAAGVALISFGVVCGQTAQRSPALSELLRTHLRWSNSL